MAQHGKKMPKPNEIAEEKYSLTVTEQRAEWNKAADMIKQLQKFTPDTRLKVLIGAGVGSEYFTCYMCGGLKTKAGFYNSTDFNVRTGITRICRKCYETLATSPVGAETDPVDASREALKYALEYLDQPFYESFYQTAIRESKSERATASSQPFKIYKNIISLPAHKGKRYKDGELPILRGYIHDDFGDGGSGKRMTPEEHEEFLKNKNDALTIAGYYPFEDEPETEQPFLYAQFSGYLDAKGGEDFAPYWLTSVISIIKDTAHLEKLDRALNELTKDPATVATNISAINNIVSSKAKLSASIAKNAQESCISLKNSRSSSRGDDTWTGRMQHLKDMNLREHDVNKFDIDTAAGMQQVADISMASIFKELSLDENDMAEIVKSQRELLSKAHHEADVSKERARLLLKENLDLKRFMKEQGLKFEHLLTNNELFDEGFFSAKPETITLPEEEAEIIEVESEDITDEDLTDYKNEYDMELNNDEKDGDDNVPDPNTIETDSAPIE